MNSVIWAVRKDPHKRLDGRQQTLGDAMVNGLDLCFSPTALGWEHAVRPLDPSLKMISRSRFIFLRLRSMIGWCLLLDFVHRGLCTVVSDSVRSLEGDTIFDLDLPPASRFLKSTVISILTFISVMGWLQVVSDAWNILCVLVLRVHPRRFAPMFCRPWKSSSLGKFWGHDWHQWTRYTFSHFGGEAIHWVTGSRRVGRVFGTFLVSGLVHDIGIVKKGADPLRITMFFLMMGVGVALEGLWTKRTGLKVGGIIGWLWTVLWMLLWGNILVDGVYRRGLFRTAESMCFFKDWNIRPSKLLDNFSGM